MMKSNDHQDLITPEELGDIIHPFFNTKRGLRVGRRLLRVLKVDELREIYREYGHLTGYHFTESVLRDPRVDVRYKVHGMEYLEPFTSGSFLTISNHPYGGLDGLILIDIVERMRSDYKVLVNGFLTRVASLNDTWIPVKPIVEKKIERHDPFANIYGLRYLSEMLRQGHPVGMFPAGGITNYKTRRKAVLEQDWQLNNVRIMTLAKVPIIPILFSGENSSTFYNLERISYGLNVLRIPAELLNKRGRTVDVFIGAPITPEMFEPYKTLKEKRSALMQYSYSILQNGLANIS